MTNSIFLQAFEGKNKQVPVWFMRQAGRFLPEYRAIKEKYSLSEMFTTPEIAAKVTCLPVEILGVDAAILFADILTLPSRMGFHIKFLNKEGPVIENLIQSHEDVERIHNFDNLDYVKDTISIVRHDLPENIPLIGFAGSPFTVLCYLLEGGSNVSFTKTFRFIQDHESAFHKLMKKLTVNTIDYLNLQKEAGIQAFQIFDTWAGILRAEDYQRLILPYAKEIFANIDLPSIYYVKNCCHLLELMDKTSANFLSVCHTVKLGENPVLKKTKKGVQGNLFPGLLYADEKILEKEVKTILTNAKKYQKYIFNLSHGILPDVEVEKVKFVVDLVHKFKR